MKKNGPKITLNHFTFFVNTLYPFNCDKPIPYHLTEGTRGNIRAKQELLLDSKVEPAIKEVVWMRHEGTMSESMTACNNHG